MSKRSTLSAFFSTIGSAIHVAAAVEGNRRAKAEHLRALGIDPAQFEQIRR